MRSRDTKNEVMKNTEIKNRKIKSRKVKDSVFSISIFIFTLVILLVSAGIHAGIVAALTVVNAHGAVSTTIIIVYWVIVSVAFTLYTRYQLRERYEKPMKDLARAADAVAHGDFSVYLPTIHTAEKHDYLDVMILDFNKMVEELGSIETLKTDFFSNVSHEIKTPLSTIIGYAESLKNNELTKEEEQECIDSIISSSKRLSGLITNILKLNKLEKQNITPISEPYDLCRQLVDCILMFEEEWEGKGIELEVDIKDKCIIEADRSLLDIVWNNLLSNAIKFTGQGGKITVKQGQQDGDVIVSVSDTGCGMNDKTLEHIFDKFYQGDSSHTTEGNGLGLAMVKRIIEITEGHIEVSSSENSGTKFIVRIPLRDA